MKAPPQSRFMAGSDFTVTWALVPSLVSKSCSNTNLRSFPGNLTTETSDLV